MTLKHYLLRSYIWLAVMLFVLGLTQSLDRKSAEFIGLLSVSVILPTISIVFLWALASNTPASKRKGYHSYKWANWVMIYPVTAAFSMVLILRVFGAN